MAGDPKVFWYTQLQIKVGRIMYGMDLLQLKESTEKLKLFRYPPLACQSPCEDEAAVQSRLVLRCSQNLSTEKEAGLERTVTQISDQKQHLSLTRSEDLDYSPASSDSHGKSAATNGTYLPCICLSTKKICSVIIRIKWPPMHSPGIPWQPKSKVYNEVKIFQDYSQVKGQRERKGGGV